MPRRDIPGWDEGQTTFVVLLMLRRGLLDRVGRLGRPLGVGGTRPCTFLLPVYYCAKVERGGFKGVFGGRWRNVIGSLFKKTGELPRSVARGLTPKWSPTRLMSFLKCHVFLVGQSLKLCRCGLICARPWRCMASVARQS